MRLIYPLGIYVKFDGSIAWSLMCLFVLIYLSVWFLFCLFVDKTTPLLTHPRGTLFVFVPRLISSPLPASHHGPVFHLSPTSLPAHSLLPPGCAGTDMMGKMLKMQMLEDEDDLAYETEKKERTSSTSDAQPAWMRTLHTTACNWLQLMPQTVNPLKRTVENIKVMARIRGKVVGKQTSGKCVFSTRSCTTSSGINLKSFTARCNKLKWKQKHRFELQ